MKKTESGIGLMVVILMVAIIAVGGAAAYQYSVSSNVAAEIKEAQLAVEVQQEVDNAKTEAQVALARIQADLATGVSVSTSEVAAIRANLQEVSAGASAEAKAELMSLDLVLGQLEVEVSNGATTAADTAAAIMMDLKSSYDTGVSASLEALDEVNVGAKNMMNTATSADADIDVSVDADAAVSDSNIDAESTTEASATLDSSL